MQRVIKVKFRSPLISYAGSQLQSLEINSVVNNAATSLLINNMKTVKLSIKRKKPRMMLV